MVDSSCTHVHVRIRKMSMLTLYQPMTYRSVIVSPKGNRNLYWGLMLGVVLQWLLLVVSYGW